MATFYSDESEAVDTLCKKKKKFPEMRNFSA